MTLKRGPMELLATEPGDVIEDYVNGLAPDGGEWTNWDRLSAHRHGGGLDGEPVLFDIPDESITADKLDPSVLAPYALLDGSKPFTGTVTMEADAIIRDALLFGQQGVTTAPDATLTRTAPNTLVFDSIVAINKANPQLFLGGTGYRGFQIRQANDLLLWQISTQDDPGASNAGANLDFLRYDNAGSLMGPGFAPALRLERATGTVHLAPNAGSIALNLAGGSGVGEIQGVQELRLSSTGGGNIGVNPNGSYLYPTQDNARYVGHPSFRWYSGYFVTNPVIGSSAALKEDITPLDPAAAMEAVRQTQPVTFAYTAPPRDASWYELPDDPEQAEAVLHQRIMAAPLDDAARHQAGFIAEQAAPLFVTGEGLTNPSNSVGVVLGALHDIDAWRTTVEARLTALEGPSA